MRRFLTPGNVALTVLAVVTVLLVALAVQRAGRLSSGPGTPLPPRPPPSVAFVGDGYTSGSPDGGGGPANYTALLAAREGWRVTNASVDGSGYVAEPPLADQVQKAADARPQLVVVSGGSADSGQDPDAVRDAAARLYGDLRARVPQATVVVIGPMWIGGDPPLRTRDVRDAIRDSATAANLPFVDPIEERWFNGRDEDGIAPDGENLDDRGHQRLSELVDDALRKANVQPR